MQKIRCHYETKVKGSVKCAISNKIKYENENIAKSAIRQQRKHRERLCQAYQCSAWHGLHLTSSKRTKEVVADSNSTSGKRNKKAYSRKGNADYSFIDEEGDAYACYN